MDAAAFWLQLVVRKIDVFPQSYFFTMRTQCRPNANSRRPNKLPNTSGGIWSFWALSFSGGIWASVKILNVLLLEEINTWGWRGVVALVSKWVPTCIKWVPSQRKRVRGKKRLSSSVKAQGHVDIAESYYHSVWVERVLNRINSCRHLSHDIQYTSFRKYEWLNV